MSSSKMVRVSSKGQIVLPKSFRDKTGISDGDYIYIEEINGILLIEKPAPSRLSVLTQQLREDALEQNFSRSDLNDAISKVRTQQR